MKTLERVSKKCMDTGYVLHPEISRKIEALEALKSEKLVFRNTWGFQDPTPLTVEILNSVKWDEIPHFQWNIEVDERWWAASEAVRILGRTVLSERIKTNLENVVKEFSESTDSWKKASAEAVLIC